MVNDTCVCGVTNSQHKFISALYGLLSVEVWHVIAEFLLWLKVTAFHHLSLSQVRDRVKLLLVTVLQSDGTNFSMISNVPPLWPIWNLNMEFNLVGSGVYQGAECHIISQDWWDYQTAGQWRQTFYWWERLSELKDWWIKDVYITFCIYLLGWGQACG